MKGWHIIITPEYSVTNKIYWLHRDIFISQLVSEMFPYRGISTHVTFGFFLFLFWFWFVLFSFVFILLGFFLHFLPPGFSGDLPGSNKIFINFQGIHSFSFPIVTKTKALPQYIFRCSF